MTTLPAGMRLQPLILPASVEDADAADFIEMVRVRNRVYREISGHDDHAIAADELLPLLRSDEHQTRLLWTVSLEDRMVGRIGVDLPLEGESKVAFWLIELEPAVWGRGMGTAAFEVVLATARENGRSVLQSWAEHPDAPGPRLKPPTGFGEIPLDHAARFYVRTGHTLEQIERSSAFDLRGSFAGVEKLLAEATAASTGYKLVHWRAPTPPEFVDGYAWMKSRMITDAPAANLEFDEETWDAKRVARHDSMYTESGRTIQVTAAQHIATGELCAFNELVIGKDLTEASSQEDTLVLKDHRGHKLGMLVKCAGLMSWREIAPYSPRMITYNAEENRPMLDINEAIGFVPIAYEGAWKRVLDE